MDQQRVVRLGGVRNLRDVGGYPARDGRQTCWRVLYRSDCLDLLDAAGQAWLVDAGLRSVIDIRENSELEQRPNVFAASDRVAYIHLPFFRQPAPANFEPDLRQGYRRELDLLGNRLVDLVETVIRPGTLPTLVHCAAGKDRTGVGIGMLLAAAGVEPEAIAADYALSEVCLGPDYLTETQAWVEKEGWEWSVWEHTAYTPPERMLLTLEYLEQRFGGVERYLLDHGLAADALTTLRELLTESV